MASQDKNGFCIPYTVRDTTDKGFGVFADSLIRKGTILWRHVRGQYAVYDEHTLTGYLAKLSHGDAVYELTHMFGVPEFPGFVIKVLDDGALLNHSQQPNVEMNRAKGDKKLPCNNMRDVQDALLDERFSLVAKQDLAAGEELTMDYNIGIEDPPYYDLLYEQYDISEPWL